MRPRHLSVAAGRELGDTAERACTSRAKQRRWSAVVASQCLRAGCVSRELPNAKGAQASPVSMAPCSQTRPRDRGEGADFCGEHLAEIVDRGVKSFKAHTDPSFPSRIAERVVLGFAGALGTAIYTNWDAVVAHLNSMRIVISSIVTGQALPRQRARAAQAANAAGLNPPARRHGGLRMWGMRVRPGLRSERPRTHRSVAGCSARSSTALHKVRRLSAVFSRWGRYPVLGA